MDAKAQLQKAQLQERIERTLFELDGLLLAERGEGSDIPAHPQEQWDLFRALVNTRPPEPADGRILELQDVLLQDILDFRGRICLEDIVCLESAGNAGNASIDASEASANRASESSAHLHLWRGDITRLALDAIVNAANSRLLGCSIPGHFCIDNAIHTFAGMQLRLACAHLMGEQGHPEPTGMAKVTDAFNLPSTYVIHTVGPIMNDHPTELDCALLANCYTACLDAAVGVGCRSIAFCCISTGVFGFPRTEAAKIAVETLRSWLARNEETIEVVFNVFSETDEVIYRELLEHESCSQLTSHPYDPGSQHAKPCTPAFEEATDD